MDFPGFHVDWLFRKSQTLSCVTVSKYGHPNNHKSQVSGIFLRGSPVDCLMDKKKQQIGEKKHTGNGICVYYPTLANPLYWWPPRIFSTWSLAGSCQQDPASRKKVHAFREGETQREKRQTYIYIVLTPIDPWILLQKLLCYWKKKYLYLDKNKTPKIGCCACS